LLLKVTRRLRGRDGSSVPRLLVPVVPLDLRTSVKTRDLVLSELDSADPFGNPIMGLINAPWDSTVTEDPRAGSVEIWHLINTTEDAHPIHIHLVQFQILDSSTRHPQRCATPARLSAATRSSNLPAHRAVARPGQTG